MEDFPDNPKKSQSQESDNIFKILNNPSHSSSFIQSILYEDSRAGVAVVDLFVAVKVVKDKLDILSRCNNEILEKLTMINKEKRAIKLGYKNLIDSMRTFLRRLSENEPEKLLTCKPTLDRPKLETEKQPPTHSNHNSNVEHKMAIKESGEICEPEKSSNNDSSRRCRCNEKNVPENNYSGSSTEDREIKHPNEGIKNQKELYKKEDECPNYALSTPGGNIQNNIPKVNEELLGSFIASLLWLKKKEKDLCIPWMTSKVISQMQNDMKKNIGRLHLSESKVEMVCDVWKILWGADQPESSNSCNDSTESNDTNLEQESSSENANCEEKENKFIISECTESMKIREDSGSDGDSIFEEALADITAPSSVQKENHNVSCMGDLSMALTERKNVGTFTTNNDVLPSWVSKLTDEIQAKIEEFKSKTNVTVAQKSGQKFIKKLRKQSGASEFVITADTPMGVFDFTVLRYHKRRRSNHSKKAGKSMGTQASRSKEPAKHKQIPLKALSDKDDEFFSDMELNNFDSGSVEENFNSGEDEFEEFVDIYVENSDKNAKTARKLRQRAKSKICILKILKSPYFTIYKFYPVHPVLEIIRKTERKAFSERSSTNTCLKDNIISINTAKMQKKEMVIKRSSSDLVIYIQVEVEDGISLNTGEVLMEYQSNSLETQTRNALPSPLAQEEDVIKLEEEQRSGESLYQIWKDYPKNPPKLNEKNFLDFDEPFVIVGDQEMELREDDLVEEEKEVMVKEPKEKSVTFNEITEIFTDSGTHKTYSKEGDGEFEIDKNIRKNTITVMSIMNAKLHADIWLIQNEKSSIQRAFIANPVNQITYQQEQLVNYVQPVICSRVELEKALILIHEIENNVMDIKLSNAISILPRLESELRKHLKNKMKSLKELNAEKENSIDNFYSAVDFLPYEHLIEVESDMSGQRLNSLLKLLSDLEEAVRGNSSDGLELCQFDSSIIYELLRELTDNIMELEKTPTVSSLSRALDVASQLDTAVREYDSAIKKQSLNVSPQTERENTPTSMSSSLEVFVNEQLKNVRKKVFKNVKKEAIDMEEKIEKYFDKIDRLERENDETMMFLETFLQKTERRVTEFKCLKTEIEDTTFSVNALHQIIIKTKEEIRKKIVESIDLQSLTSGIGGASENKPEDSVASLLMALDSLKTKAREKNEICKEILFSIGFNKALASDKPSLQSSRPSFTAKHIDTITSTVKDFKKIGDSSLYLSWTKPTSSSSVSLLGYEIHVNGTVNQKVRNPQRLQAILYSVDLSKENEIHLYALTDAESKILLATLTYSDK